LNEVIEPEVEVPQKLADELYEIDLSDMPSPTLARLIEEVRNEEAHNAHAYNRMHNRHNRSR
jgi:hypothetical protein